MRNNLNVHIHLSFDVFKLSGQGTVWEKFCFFLFWKRICVTICLSGDIFAIIKCWLTCLSQIRTHIDPQTGCVIPYCPNGRFVHIPPPYPDTNWANDFGRPWWKDDGYLVGILSAKTRFIKIINTLTSQEQVIEVRNWRWVLLIVFFVVCLRYCRQVWSMVFLIVVHFVLCVLLCQDVPMT